MQCSKMADRILAVLFAVLVCCCVDGLQEKSSEDEYDLTVRLDHAVSERHDDLVCTGAKFDPEEAYIVRFTPHASKDVAHHLMVFGCSEPSSANYTEPWHCYNSDGLENSVCKTGTRQILFAWALDAPSKSLPEGVGLRISGTTGIDYVVVQLHYAKQFKAGQTDDSGVTLHITKKRPPQQAGYLVLGDSGFIPPQQPAFHMESSCYYTRNYTIYPIGYRTHAHNLGLVTSGYRVRDNKWTEIGRMSPQLPQTFYQVTNPGIAIRPGDRLASRCTMNSMSRSKRTYIGSENWDEMCNFYIMYSTYHQQNLRTDYCFQNAQEYHWIDDFDSTTIPTTASSLAGISKADEVVEKFREKALHVQ